MTAPASAGILDRILDRVRPSDIADGLAIAIAVSLPWSTSITSALLVVWVLALWPTVRPGELARSLAHPAAGLPIVLWALGMVGMLWSEATVAEQLFALKGFHKLLVIPLLFIQFRRSDKGPRLLAAYLASCTALLVVSWVLHFVPHPVWHLGPPGVPVKDYIVQSVEFLICTFALGHLAIDAWRDGRRRTAIALAALAVLFIANVAFVATGRTSMAAFPVLVLLFGAQRFGWKGSVGLVVGAALFAAAIWASSPYLRERAFGVAEEIQDYKSEQAKNSAGFRLEFWKKSLTFVADAPVAGHGTGSIPILFRHAAIGDSGIAASVTGNPHNLILEIAIQFGLIGAIVLFAMWMAHLMVFRGSGLTAWLGQGLVVQTIMGSLVLSYLLDFSNGWLYALGVGVLAGMAQRERGASP